jgi:hypothetical protein
MRRLFFIFASVAWAVLIYHLTTTPQIIVTSNSWMQDVLMNSAHMGFFGVEAVLLYFCFPSVYFSVLSTSFYGALIEVIQLHLPGRTADPKDWMFDTLGAIVFVWIMRKYLVYHNRES